jgi:hypothetical protein
MAEEVDSEIPILPVSGTNLSSMNRAILPAEMQW